MPTPIEKRLQRIWQDTLAIRPIGLDDDFFELGGHSLLAVRLLDAVAAEFSQTLRLASFFQAPTVRAQAALLAQEQPVAALSSIVGVQSRGRRPPLFVVSGFGAAILPFRALAQHLGIEQPLYVLDLGVLGGTEIERSTLEAMATRMIADVREVQSTGPYQLAGFSLGGLFVYEMSRQLSKAGEKVALLALLDTPAPGYPALRSFPVRVALHVKHAYQLGAGAAIAYLAERIRRLRKYARPIEPTVFDGGGATTLMRTIEAAARTIYRAWKVYRPGHYPGSMLMIRAGIRPHQPGALDNDPAQGWGALVGGRIVVETVDCVHTELLEPRHSAQLAARLSAHLSAQHKGPSRPTSSSDATATTGRHTV